LVKAFLVSNAGFATLCHDLRELTYYNARGIMQTISDEALQNINFQPRTVDATILIPNWDIVEVMKDQYEPGQSLAQTLMIVGTGKKAYKAPCLEYMKLEWPELGESTLDALEVFLTKGTYNTGLSSLAVQLYPPQIKDVRSMSPIQSICSRPHPGVSLVILISCSVPLQSSPFSVNFLSY